MYSFTSKIAYRVCIIASGRINKAQACDDERRTGTGHARQFRTRNGMWQQIGKADGFVPSSAFPLCFLQFFHHRFSKSQAFFFSPFGNKVLEIARSCCRLASLATPICVHVVGRGNLGKSQGKARLGLEPSETVAPKVASHATKEY